MRYAVPAISLAPPKPPGNQIRLPVSLRTSLTAFKVASCTAFIQTCPSVPCLEARPAKSTPLVSQCRLDRTPPVDGHLFDREPYGGESERAIAPDPDNFWPRGGLGRSRGTCLPPATMSSLACQNPIKRRCAVNRDTPAKPGAMMFFSYLSSVTLADSEKKPSGKPFQHHPSTDRPLTPPPPANARS